MVSSRVLIEYSTKQRPQELARSLASLLDQDYQNFDVLVINDYPKQDIMANDILAFWTKKLIDSGHEFWLIDGSQISQAHNHNIPLWDKRWRAYERIMRMDDDILLNKYCISKLVEVMDNDATVVGVSGLWFENEHGRYSDRMTPSQEQWDSDREFAGKIDGGIASNWQQRAYHINRDNLPYEVEHLYSACLYSAEAMRRVGGWPEIYTKGVAHGEETDGTYRLHLSGGKLVIKPLATGQHLKAGGGIRATGNLGAAQMLDSQKLNYRLAMFNNINLTQPITVAVSTQHSAGLGGAQREFYHTVALLQQIPNLDVYPIFSSEYVGPEKAKEYWGVEYQPRIPLAKYDVSLQFSHNPRIDVCTAKAHIASVFFPNEYANEGDLEKNIPFFDILCGISDFSCEFIEKVWSYKTRKIYPAVRPIKALPKKNWIIYSGRLDQWKAPLWLAEQFVKMNLDGWEFHIIGSTTKVYAAYEDQVRQFCQEHPNVVLHEDISQAELESIFGQAQILWAAKGIYCSEEFLREAEHFGYTPVEALSAEVVPIAFNLGGHRETVDGDFLWNTAEELIDTTNFVINQGIEWYDGEFIIGDSSYGEDSACTMYPVDLSPYSEEEYVAQLLKAIYQANAKTVQLERIAAGTTSTKITTKVACISDSPNRATGFGTVANEVYKGFLDAGFDVHVMAMLDWKVPADHKKYGSWWPCYNIDSMGNQIFPSFLAGVKPDVIWMLYDPGTMHARLLSRDFATFGNTKTIGYFPIEGLPVAPGYAELATRLTHAVTYCKCGVAGIKDANPKAEVDYVYHGLDHAPFRKLTDVDRGLLRKLCGLDKYYVIGAVATNKRTKEWPYLLEMARILKQRGYGDIVRIYAHTNPDEPILQGHPLSWMLDRYRVDDMFLFTEPGREVSYEPSAQFEIDSLRYYSVPPTMDQRRTMFSLYPMIYRYNCMDLYIDTSSVEGFGLPMGEAMACGVPVVMTDDYAAKQEIYSAGAYVVAPAHWDTWHTGARLWLANPEKLADAVVSFINQPKMRNFYSDIALECASLYHWDDVRRKFVSLVRGV